MKVGKMTKRQLDKQKLIEKISREADAIEDNIMHSYLIEQKKPKFKIHIR